jgi:hypothetical protein
VLSSSVVANETDISALVQGWTAFVKILLQILYFLLVYLLSIEADERIGINEV